MVSSLDERAWSLVPILRESARASEDARRIPSTTIAQADAMGLFDLMVPARYGGKGLGVAELCQISRILSQGDASAAWVIAFIIQHNWMACRLPQTARDCLYDNKSWIAAASSLQACGTATLVDEGYVVSGRWSFASAALSSTHTFFAAKLENSDEQLIMIIPLSEATLEDDWYMSGMRATESISFTLDNIFIPYDMALSMDAMFSADRHPGIDHAETIYHISMLPGAAAMLASFPLGCAQAALQIITSRIQEHGSNTKSRWGNEPSRLRWARAHQLIRGAELIWSSLISKIERKGECRSPWTDVDMGQLELDRVTIVHQCKDAVRLLVDGAGAGAFRSDDALQRCLRDIDVLANHIAHDQDIVSIRGAGQILGAR